MKSKARPVCRRQTRQHPTPHQKKGCNHVDKILFNKLDTSQGIIAKVLNLFKITVYGRGGLDQIRWRKAAKPRVTFRSNAQYF